MRETLKVGGDVKSPVIVSRVEPQIPPGTKCRGMVLFRSVIDEQGNITDVEDLSKPRDAISSACRDALLKTKFRPATLHGKPVRVEYSVTYNFRCQ